MLEVLPLRVQAQLVSLKLAVHPLPWRIDYDWTVEVIDAKGNCVMKLMNDAEAKAFITFAEALAQENADAQAEVDQLLKEHNIEP